MTIKEMTDIIYDTLMGNVSTPYNVYEAFDLSKVLDQEVDVIDGLITFDYEGLKVKINITGRTNGCVGGE